MQTLIRILKPTDNAHMYECSVMGVGAHRPLTLATAAFGRMQDLGDVARKLLLSLTPEQIEITKLPEDTSLIKIDYSYFLISPGCAINCDTGETVRGIDYPTTYAAARNLVSPQSKFLYVVKELVQ